MSDAQFTVADIPEGHIIVGHLVIAKVLDEKGEEYWATRSSGVNDMETYGMAMNAVDNIRVDLTGSRVIRGE